MKKIVKQPCFYIPHGGGPCFFMDWTPPDTWTEMGTYLGEIGNKLTRQPDALVIISAHWEADPITITAHQQPDLIYDYYGFPDQTYQLTWPAPGAPTLAANVLELLTEAGIPAQLDSVRGFDHGVFIPMKLAFPDAQIPTIQISLHPSLDPDMHLALGRALASLRTRNILLIGSGMSFHDVAALMGRKTVAGSQDFDGWLTAAIRENSETREALLTQWQDAPAAKLCHPREEHLLPLHVIAGAAGQDTGISDYQGNVLGAAISAYRFG